MGLTFLQYSFIPENKELNVHESSQKGKQVLINHVIKKNRGKYVSIVDIAIFLPPMSRDIFYI